MDLKLRKLISWRNGFVALLVIDFALGTLAYKAYTAQRHRADTIAYRAAHLLAPPQVRLARSGKYLAIGDSYSAGEGLGPFLGGTGDISEGGDRCHRSPQGYPRRLEVPGHPLEFRACSGALIQNVLDVVQDHNGVLDSQGLQIGPDQLGPDGHLDPAVALITVSIGGNDMDFADVLSFCALSSHCMDDRYGPCGTLRACVEADLANVDLDLRFFYQELRAAAGPTVRIVALGYPALFPETLPSVWTVQYKDCQLLRLWDESERMGIRTYGLQLDEIIAKDAKGAGVEYIDTFKYFSGHEPCTPSEWMNYVNASGDRAVRDGSFHPNPLGQAMMARMIACHLTTYRSAAEALTGGKDNVVDACVAKGEANAPASVGPPPG